MAPKKPHVAGSTGFRFETKMTAFTALRLYQTSKEFYLSSNNNKECKKLDDIVYAAVGRDNKWAAWFIQIKHKLNKEIRDCDLIGGESNDDFAFHTYLESFQSISEHYEKFPNRFPNSHPIFGQHIEKKHFVLFTNAPLNVNIPTRCESDPIIFRTSNEKGVKFSLESNCNLLKNLAQKPNYLLLTQFTESFILCPNQLDESSMDKMILEEIAKIHRGLTVNEIELATQKWIQFIQDWSGTKDLLSESKVGTQLKEFIQQVQIGKKKSINLEFIPSFTSNWKKILGKKSEQFIYMTVDAENTQLAMALLKQLHLTSYPNIELSIQDFSGDYAKKKQKGILVMDCSDDSICNDEQLEEIRETCVNRVILVATNKNPVGRKMAPILQAHPKPFKCDLSHLTEASREVLLERNKFRFQGHDTDLSTIIETELQLVNTSMLTKLCEILPEIGSEFGVEIPFYVPRTLTHKTAVSQGFFYLPTKSRFGLINADGLLLDNTRVTHLKDESEFEEFSKADVPFHMFEAATGNTFNWRKSSKNIHEITAHLKNKGTLEMRENILQINERIVLISGKPGIGKSTLLQHLAASTKKFCPNYWIVTIALSDYKAYFLREDFSSNVVNDLITVAAGIDQRNQFHAQFFNYCYQSGKMILMLDGFDEIDSDNGLVMLDTLSRAPLAKLWITTRSICRERLEEKLKVLSYTIRPFSKFDQKKFLQQFWKLHDNNDKYIIETLKSVASAFNEKFQNFTGIPLHTRMIAEVCNPKKLRVKTINAVVLFQEFIKINQQAFVNKYKPLMPISALKVMEEDHEEKLISLALLALLPTETCAKLEPPVTDIDGLKKFVADGSSSIVLSFHEVPRFIHSLFAEYYAALYFNQHFPTNRNFINSDQFGHANFEFVRYFLDRFLAKGCLLHEALLAGDCGAVKRMLEGGGNVNVVDRGGRTALHIAAGIPNSESVILAMISAGANTDREDRIFGWRAVQYAMKAELSENCGPLIKHSKDIEASVPVTWIVLLYAIRGDYYKTFLHLLDNGLSEVEDLESLRPRKWINENEEHSMTVMHLAAAHNANKILKHLVRGSKHLIEKTDQNGRTPLLWAAKSGHAESLLILLNAGADLYKTSNKKKTVAIYAVKKQNSDILLTFLADMRKRNMTPIKYLSDVIVKLVWDKSDWATTMFSYLIAMYPGLISIDTAQNMNLLSTACIIGNERIVKKLLDLGAETQKMTPKGTVMHLAVKAGHLAVVKLLLENHVPVNIPDGQGATPIYHAARRGFAEIFFLLVNAGAVLNTITVNMDNLAHAAARSSQPDICKFLSKKGINFNVENKFSETGMKLLKNNQARALVNQLEIKFIPPQVDRNRNKFRLSQVPLPRPVVEVQPTASTSYGPRDYKSTHWFRKDCKTDAKTPPS